MTSQGDDVPRREESSWFGGRYLWDSPKVRKEKLACGNYIEEPLHEDWLELFTDLMLVAFYMRLSAAFAMAGWQNGWALMAAFISFWNLFHGMYSMTYFINMFDSDCLARLLFLSLVPLGVCISVLNVQVNEETHIPDTDTVFGFGLGFGIQRVGLAILYLQVWLSVPGLGSVPGIIGFGFVFSIFISEGIRWFSNDPWILVTSHFLVAVNELGSKALAVRRQRGHGRLFRCLKTPTRNVGVHIGHIQARTGIAVMVALGESIIQLLNVEYHEGFEQWRLHFTLGGFLLTFALAMIYFDSQPHSIEGHVLRLSSKRAITHRFVFPFLIFSIWVIGAAFELVLASGQSDTEHVTPAHAAPESDPHEPHHALIADLTRDAALPLSSMFSSSLAFSVASPSAASPALASSSSSLASPSPSSPSSASSLPSSSSSSSSSSSYHPGEASAPPEHALRSGVAARLEDEDTTSLQEYSLQDGGAARFEDTTYLQDDSLQDGMAASYKDAAYLQDGFAAARRLSHVHHDWTLDASCMLFSISIGLTHILMTYTRHVHTGMAGLKTNFQRVRALFRVCIGISHCFVFLVVKQFKLSASQTALTEVWGHILLTIPMIVSTLRLKGQSHGHEHDHHDHEHHCQQDQTHPLVTSFRSMTQIGSIPPEDFYPDPFTHNIEEGVDVDNPGAEQPPQPDEEAGDARASSEKKEREEKEGKEERKEEATASASASATAATAAAATAATAAAPSAAAPAPEAPADSSSADPSAPCL